LLDDLEKFGTDATRFAIAASLIPGSYMMLPDSRIRGYRNFANKLWNASRFVLMNLQEDTRHKTQDTRQEEDVATLESRVMGLESRVLSLSFTLCDKWIRSRFNSLVQNVTDALESYRFSDAAQSLYDFLWHEYCDWYLELAKMRIYDQEDDTGRRTAQYVAWQILEGTLKLLHPIMPFITEEIWQHLPHDGESIMVADWPEASSDMLDEEAENDMQLLIDVIRALRNIYSEMNVPPSSKAQVFIQVSDDAMRAVLSEHAEYIYRLANASKVTIEADIQKPASSAAAVVSGGREGEAPAEPVEIYVPLADLIDIEREKERLTKLLEKAVADLDRTDKTLANESFLTKAPADIVAKERAKKAELDALKAKLERNLEMLAQDRE
jgi:valyl-tRNA synthetase